MRSLKNVTTLTAGGRGAQWCWLVAKRAQTTSNSRLAAVASQRSAKSAELEAPAPGWRAAQAAKAQPHLSASASASAPGAAECPAEAEGLAAELEPATAHRFSLRHLGPRPEDVTAMLQTLGYQSMDELIDATLPQQIRLRQPLQLPAPLSEQQLVEELKELAKLNEATEWRNFIGQGYYDCVTPPAIARNMFENPGWTTAYTAYQAEISQGRLEALMNYQTMVSDLTGLDVANASLLDEATAAAEALQVCLRQDRLKRQRLLVSSRCHPQTLAVVRTRAAPLGVQVDLFDELAEGAAGSPIDFKRYAGLLVQYPNTQGHLYDLGALTERAHAGQCLVVAATDLLACALFTPPGDFRCDLACGSSQRLGVPLNFGGPHAAFLACKRDLVRQLPGRVVGLTRDSNGQPAFRFALQTREQHIRRDKATSNICTAQALLANMSSMYAVYHGPDGLRDIARSVHAKTNLLAHLVGEQQRRQGADHGPRLRPLNEMNFFDTLTYEAEDVAQLRKRALEAKINLRYDNHSKTVGVSLDETTRFGDILRLANLLGGRDTEGHQATTGALGGGDSPLPLAPVDGPLAHLKRQSAYLEHPVFNQHKSEAQLIRYMKRLENKDISLVHSMIPLGSCTMKLNATAQMLASSWPEFAQCHPFQPVQQCRGYLQLFKQLDGYLCELTGYDRISFQPNSGAQGEYAGLRVIKSYLEARDANNKRNVCLIPISAHGTNPASARMAGFDIQTIKVLPNGNIDPEDLKKQIDRHASELACLMITYPSTYGVFEDNVREVCELVHRAGGQVYLDGANMNAQVGLCRPGDYGSDVSHLNLHKTFCIPHGGGGPGAGPIGVKSHLIPYLPSHPLFDGAPDEASDAGADHSFGTVSAAMWGSPAILPISWSYIRLMGEDLKKSTELAILNANYMRKRLEKDFKILFRGSSGNVAHEFIIDCRDFKRSANIEAIDIAKRLQDFGFHAPTVSWPVTNALMVEPTESEDRQQLDSYCDALLAIRAEIGAIEAGQLDRELNPIRMAPHTQQVICAEHWSRPYSRLQAAFPAPFVRPETKVWPTVGRVDDTYGDTHLFCTCAAPEAGSL